MLVHDAPATLQRRPPAPALLSTCDCTASWSLHTWCHCMRAHMPQPPCTYTKNMLVAPRPRDNSVTASVGYRPSGTGEVSGTPLLACASCASCTSMGDETMIARTIVIRGSSGAGVDQSTRVARQLRAAIDDCHTHIVVGKCIRILIHLKYCCQDWHMCAHSSFIHGIAARGSAYQRTLQAQPRRLGFRRMRLSRLVRV